MEVLMKYIIKIQIALLLLVTGMFAHATFLPQNSVPKLQEVAISDVYLKSIDGENTQLVALVKYTNECNEFENKVKTKANLTKKINYTLYGYNNSYKLCLTVMDPIEKEVIIDVIPTHTLDNIDELKVNSFPINL